MATGAGGCNMPDGKKKTDVELAMLPCRNMLAIFCGISPRPTNCEFYCMHCMCACQSPLGRARLVRSAGMKRMVAGIRHHRGMQLTCSPASGALHMCFPHVKCREVRKQTRRYMDADED